MCGIAGTFLLKADADKDGSFTEALNTALQNIRHRGPDCSSMKEFPSGALGHNRLRVLDLSAGADQPMSDTEGRYWIAFNGEIFNHQVLRTQLEKAGTAFKTHSDTEVLLHMLIRHGEKALDDLNGFFAFAFYDTQEHELLVARDRFGEKPLWFHADIDRLCFASELKALRAFNVPTEIDPVSLSMFLQFSYIPAPFSIFRHVHKILPGHVLKLKNGEIAINKWYHAPSQCITEKNRSQVTKKFGELLQDAVAIRMNADVPVSCFLSGGVDSSVIAMLAARRQPGLPTFSVGFPDESFMDETVYALEIAKHINTQHEVIPIHSKNLLDEIENVWNALDEPFADSSAIAMSMLSRMVKKKVTVALSGDGADEILGGYNKHAALLRSMQKKGINGLLPILSPLIDVFPGSRGSRLGNKFRQLKKYTDGLPLSLKDRYLLWASWADEETCERLINQELSVQRGARINSFVQDIHGSDFNTVLLADQMLVLSNDMLPKVDMMSMLHGLEVRPPFLDHRVVEFVNALPLDFKISTDRRKILLYEAFGSQLPARVFTRPKKGFEVPMEKWLRQELKPAVMEMLHPEIIAADGLFNMTVIQEVLDSFYKRRSATHTSLIYSLLVFQVWKRRLSAS